MTLLGRKHHGRGFTLVELLATIVVAFVAFGILLPGITANRHRGEHYARIRCLNNLKQVGLAFRIWAGDNNGMYPMKYYTNESGAPEFADATNGFRYFQVMSNELSTPRILICPEDTRHLAATNFTRDFNGSHLSYFIGLEADKTRPNAFLAGDRNLANGQKPLNGVLEVRTNQNIGWTKEMHNDQGNIALADGSVQQLSSKRLKELLAASGMTTNRLLMP